MNLAAGSFSDNIGWWIGIPALFIGLVLWGMFFAFMLNGGTWCERTENCGCKDCRRERREREE